MCETRSCDCIFSIRNWLDQRLSVTGLRHESQFKPFIHYLTLMTVVSVFFPPIYLFIWIRLTKVNCGKMGTISQWFRIKSLKTKGILCKTDLFCSFCILPIISWVWNEKAMYFVSHTLIKFKLFITQCEVHTV